MFTGNRHSTTIHAGTSSINIIITRSQVNIIEEYMNATMTRMLKMKLSIFIIYSAIESNIEIYAVKRL